MNSTVLFNQFAKGKTSVKIRSNNCVIYTRVSTKEQADNNMSLATQRKVCEQYAVKNNFAIMGNFGGTYESAKTDERKEFNNMLSFVKNSRQKISYIIVYSVDRFSRSGANAIYITEQLKTQGVNVISVTQPTDSTTPSGSLQQNIQFIFSEYDNQLRREKCMSGVKEALLRGEWCHKPPTGYDTIKENGKRKIVVNAKGKLLRKAFLWKTEKGLSNEEIKKRLASMGLKVSHQFISALFKNPFYCGLLSHNALEGELVEGHHEKLVSREIFLEVNGILSTNHHGYKTNEERKELPLKRFMRCEDCAKFMRGYVVKKKNLYYYKCNTPGCKNNKRADDLHKNFSSALERFNINDEEMKDGIAREMIAEYEERITVKEDEAVKCENQLAEIDKKLERLEERFILEEISAEMFRKYKDRFNAEKAEIEKLLMKSGRKMSNLEECVNVLLNSAENISEYWGSADYVTKQRVQFWISSEGLLYDKKTNQCRTSSLNPVLARIACQMQEIEGNKKGIPELNIKYAALVEPEGVEPSSKKGT